MPTKNVEKSVDFFQNRRLSTNHKKVHISLIVIILVFFLTPFMLFSQNYPLVTEKRPRINIPDDRFASIRASLNDVNQERIDSLFSTMEIGTWAYNDLICNSFGNAHGIKLCGLESEWEWSWNNEGRALNALKLILLYYHTGREVALNKKRINFIANQFIAYVDAFSYDNTEPYPTHGMRYLYLEKNFRFISKFGPILFDWGHNALNGLVIEPQESIRSILANKLWQISHDFMKYFVYRGYYGELYWENDYYAGGHQLQNDMLNMKLVLSLYHSQDLSEEKRDALSVRYRFLYDNLKNELIPIIKFYVDDNNDGDFNEDEGNTHWGGTYNFILRICLIEYFDLITNATNQNLYEENPWVNSLVNQYFYLFKPDETSLHIGDDYKDFSESSYENSIISLFNNFDTPRNHWMMKEYKNHNYLGTSTRIDEIMFRDFSKSLIPSSTNPGWLSWFSDKTGTHIYKSSFDSDATMFTFLNAPSNKNNHQHLDNNSFQIYKHGPLFIDSGAYDEYPRSNEDYVNNHFLNYYTRTIAHNAVTIFDPDEQYIYNDQLLSNDGGQTLKSDLKNYNDIIANYDYINSWPIRYNIDEFTYMKSDATSSYSSHKVVSYIRKVLYLKYLNRVIILDHIDQPNLSNQFQVKWNAHFRNKPAVYNENGSIAQPIKISGNNILRYDNYERDFFVSNADIIVEPIGGNVSPSGNAKIRTLLPIDVEATLVGGSGYEYYVNGTNYPPTDDTISEGANWRMEIGQSSLLPPRKSIHFLNTIEIGDNISPAENTSELISTANSSVVLKWDEILFFFGKSFSGSANDSHKTNISSLEDGNYKIYAYDLLPSRLYHVKKGSTILISIPTNSYGFLQTDMLNITGNDLKIVLANIIGDGMPTMHKSLKLIPNAINNGETLDIIIDENSDDGIKSISIYNINGLLIMEGIFKGNIYTLPNLKLKPGVFIIKVANNAEVMEAKLIVN